MRRAMKMLRGSEHPSYEDGLRELRLAGTVQPQEVKASARP